MLDETELRNIGTGPRKQFLFTHNTFEAFLGPFWTFGLYYLVDSAAIAGHLGHAANMRPELVDFQRPLACLIQTDPLPNGESEKMHVSFNIYLASAAMCVLYQLSLLETEPTAGDRRRRRLP